MLPPPACSKWSSTAPSSAAWTSLTGWPDERYQWPRRPHLGRQLLPHLQGRPMSADTAATTHAWRDLDGHTAFITGSGRNIGRAIALEFASRGANVIVNSRTNQREANAVADECRVLGAETA